MMSRRRRESRKENAVSLLERLGRGHLDDDVFARLWADGFDGDRPAHPHLDACAVCRDRFAQFGAWLQGVGDEMRDEADGPLTPERLAVQQAHIARRLELLDRPARVIAFPKAARAVISGHSHVRRWVTVAAAASLIAGFGLGQVVPPLRAIRRPHVAAATPLTKPMTQKIANDIVPASTTFSDEELLSVDSFARLHVNTLSALDDMTPHARDTVLGGRSK
jgi:hypothetical protein